MELRPYQRHLVNLALSAGNHIIVLPTGAGKTLISLEVAFQAMQQYPKRTVLYLAPKVALVIQQFEVFREEANRRHLICQLRPFGRFCGRHRSAFAGFEHYSVVFCTPAKFLQIVDGHSRPLSQLSLLVLDECHHAIAKRRQESLHPYSIVADIYCSEPPNLRPKVVNLTASPGDSEAVAKRLCYKLDATLQHLHSQSKDAAKVKEVVPSAKLTCVIVPFSPSFIKLVKACETTLRELQKSGCNPRELRPVNMMLNRIQSIAWCDDTNWDCLQQCPALDLDVGLPLLQSSLNQLKDSIACGPDLLLKKRRLKEYLRSLIGVDSCPKQKPNDVEWFVPCPCYCEEMGLSPIFVQLLATLQVGMQKMMRAGMADNFRAIVFVETRRVAQDLRAVLDNLASKWKVISWIKATAMVGHSRNVDDELCFTAARQAETLKAFRDGFTNVMIATSVAEEGIDVPKCSLVVRMELPQTIIQMIQSRGRARYSNSDYVVLCLGEEAKHLVLSIAAKEKEMRRVLDSFENGPRAENNWDFPYTLDKEWDSDRMERSRSRSPHRAGSRFAYPSFLFVGDASSDWKGKLSAEFQANQHHYIDYRLVAKTGPDHCPQFTSEVQIDGNGEWHQGVPMPRQRDSEQSAAYTALRALRRLY